MITRTIADLTFEVHAPHQYRLVVPDDPLRPGHQVWMVCDGRRWHLIYRDGKGGQRQRTFASRNEIISLLINRRMAI